MGIDLLSWALSKVGRAWPKGPDRLLFLVIAELAHDEDAFCWPGVELLRQRCNVEDRTSIERGINRLIERGWIANDERYVARAGRPVDGQKRGYKLLVPAEDWAPISAKHSAKRPAKERRSGAALQETRPPAPTPRPECRFEAAIPSRINAAPVQGNAAPEPKECRSDARALRKEPLLNLYGTNPPSPPDGGSGLSTDRLASAERTARAGLQALAERLWREQGRQITRKTGRVIKRRLSAGEPPESVWDAFFAPLPDTTWNPPQSEDPAAVEKLAEIALAMREKLPEHSWCTWIAPIVPVRLERKWSPVPTLVVAFPGQTGHEWLARNFGETLAATARNVDTIIKFWNPSDPVSADQEPAQYAHA